MEEFKPKVSVIIPLHNQSNFLLDAINSVLSSTYKNIEIIVVNDGSTDITPKELKSILPIDVKLINIEHSGVCNARNVAIANSRGEYILPLDADDRIHETYIEKAISILDKNPNICIVYANAEYFGNKTGDWFFPEYNKINMLIDNLIPSFAIFRKSSWEITGGYNTDMEIGGEDWEFWISLIELGGSPYKINETLLYYRRHNMSKTAHNYESLHWEIFKRILRLHPYLYLDNIIDIAFPLFFRIFKELKLRQQLKYIIKLFNRAVFHPVTKIINRRNLTNIKKNINIFNININNILIKNNYKKILNKLKYKKQIKVVFLCSESSKWNFTELYNKLKKDKLFDPKIILYPQKDILINKDKISIEREVSKEYSFFKELNIDVDYMFTNNKYFPINKIKPDIVFYEQPYGIPKEYSIKNMSKYALCLYTSYGYEILDLLDNYTQNFHKRLHTYFVENEYQISRYEMYSSGNKENCVISGCVKMEMLNNENIIQSNTQNKINIIYAPHHSLEQDSLKFATFLNTGKQILEFAQKYKNEINWIFKPHPRLKYSLIHNKVMTENEVNTYYAEWKKFGSIYETGNYFNLFQNSYALITDSISFLAEYLPTKKPIIQLVNPCHCPYNEIGNLIDKVLYKTYTQEDFEQIFNDVVLQKKDYLKENRMLIIPQIYDSSKSPSELILNYLKKQIKGESEC
ncbi:glycosyltransferase [bacterium]|nr:glycosyltransferase [bacterium]